MDNLGGQGRDISEDEDSYMEFMENMANSIQADADAITVAGLAVVVIVNNPPPRVRRHSGVFTGNDWIDDMLISCDDTRIFNAFRMNKYTFRSLCSILFRKYGLKGTSEFSVKTKVGLFLHILAKKDSNRDAQERFACSAETVSRNFHDVLNAMDLFGRDIVKPRDPQFRDVPEKIQSNPRYHPFKDAIGALDGSHVKIVVDEHLQMACRGRKRETTMNVLAICDFDMLFTFVVTGWEGSAHDASILADSKRSFNYPTPPDGKFYLADKGYANRGRVVTPFSTARYHSSQWRGAPPTGREEIFNKCHSSLRSVIERVFGVLKKRWCILDCVPHYSPTVQSRIVSACFSLNNYIRLLDPLDSIFIEFENEYVGHADGNEEDNGEVADDVDVGDDPNEMSMDDVRNAIADEVLACN